MSTRATSAIVSDLSGISECLDRLAAQKHSNRPVSTYRLQLHSGFRFEDARRLVPYLHALGITHAYASPVLKARPGSRHGYDITDHNSINPEIGTEENFRAFVAELKAHGMELILDTVPNHMGIGFGNNPWWQDVLQNGRSSEYAAFFDIDWEPFKSELCDKVLIPMLGDQYGEELEQGRLRLNYEDGQFRVQYYDKPLPIDPQTVPIIFEPLDDLRLQPPAIAPSDEDRAELENVLWELRQLPPHRTTDPDLVARRRRQMPELQERLRSLTQRSDQVGKLIEHAVRLCNGVPGDPRSFDTLHRLLEAQAYRLAHWRVSAQEINYRRFFDINELVGLRMEDPRVFAATHRLIRTLLADGSIAGLRIDHPDGLLNPVQYFTRVQMLYAASQCTGPEPRPPLAENGIELEIQELFGHHDWMGDRAPLYVAAEKILQRGERLPTDWPVDGTVGYDFTNLVNGIFIDRSSERALTHLYRRFVGGPVDPELMVYQAKKLIMNEALSSELTVLSHMLDEISSADRRARDFTRSSLTDAIRETIACFPVYRTYIDERGNVADRDRAYINEAILRAKRRNPGTSTALFDFLRDILLLKPAGESIASDTYRKRLAFALKFQQLTGPVMAKGLEDTVCYVYNRLISVNEVGGSPREFGVSVEEFHRGNLERSDRWRYSMLATSTHDTKRSEDVRARINVISEMPRTWATQVSRWRRANRTSKRTLPDGRVVPDFNEEYFLYQTLVGAWPLQMRTQQDRDAFTRRIQQAMNKAVHEAKVNLSWVNPDEQYVQALEEFVARILKPGKRNQFLAQIEAFVPQIAYFGAINSLAQTLLKITVPGVPDTYQGNELWDFSLVDPDNRRPVDFELRCQLLQDLNTRPADLDVLALCHELLERWQDGRLKLWTTSRALQFRRQHASLFQSGSYLPLEAGGDDHEHLVAFAREHSGEIVVVAVPRLAYTLMKGQPEPPLGEVWRNTELRLPPGQGEFVNIFTGETLASGSTRTLLCREVFAHFPVALLAGR
ncbi:MAG: malto-oligosyltrehalose synthase [Terriglobales bacterium]